MAGPLSKHAWIVGFTEYPETKDRCRLLNLRKPWEGAYFNWLKVRRLVRKAIHSSLDAHDSKPGDLQDLCPACFYRDPEDKSPVFLAIDGIFQHKRFAYVSRDQTVEDWGEAFVPTPEKLNAPWMERAIRTTDDVGPCDDINSSGCPHRHAAANSTGRLKPKSLTKFDETGLMCITCRHGTGIRCLNLYGGEDRGSTLRLVQSISENLPADSKIYLLYDIACKFHPYLKRVDPGLAARITSSLNAFHVFCHDIVCQLQWGPRQIKGLGEFDGEGCERLWAGLRYLVSALRFSSAQNRIDLLDARILYRGRAARRSLCASLAFALHGSKKSPGTLERLRGLEESVDEAYRRHTPSEPCSKAQYEDILRHEFEAYKAFLLTEVKAPKGMRESYVKMLQVERHFGYGPSVEGNLRNTRLLGRSVDPSALPKEWGSLTENTKNELCSCGVVEHDWAAIHEAFCIERTWQNLDTIKFALNENYAARMLELRNIKSRASGLKEARPLMNALRRRTSKVNEKINEYNRVRKLLPKECRPPKVDDQTFSVQALEATFGQFELDYGLKQVVHQGFRISVSPETLKAVNAIQRLVFSLVPSLATWDGMGQKAVVDRCLGGSNAGESRPK